jgi:hypothetical protein
MSTTAGSTSAAIDEVLRDPPPAPTPVDPPEPLDGDPPEPPK